MSHKKYHQLKAEQRYKIETLLKIKISVSKIAKELKVHRSTIYREINRNKYKNRYKANYAIEVSGNRKERFNYHRSLTISKINFIRDKLIKEQWSPEQISCWCKVNNIEMVSHETIYKYILKDKKEGGFLYKHLRIASKPYRKRYGSIDRRGKIKNRVSIEQRPDIVDNRKRIGDWEVDTIIGGDRKTAMLTIVERASLYTHICYLERKTAELTKQKMINALSSYKNKLFTITGDNGTEFTKHEEIAKKLDVDFYFTHPYSSWEKGTNENTNGLIRQYFPKRSDFKKLTIKDIKDVENKLNNRPRKSLGFRTPKQVFFNFFP